MRGFNPRSPRKTCFPTAAHTFAEVATCTLENFPYVTMQSRLSTGDSLVLVSDGVPEAMNRAQELFGRGRVGSMLAAMPAGLSAEERVNAVNGEIRKYSEGTEQADDVTVLVVRWHGPKRVTSDE